LLLDSIKNDFILHETSFSSIALLQAELGKFQLLRTQVKTATMTMENFEPDGTNFGVPVEAATADAIFKSHEQLIRCSNVTECGSSYDARRVVPKHIW